MIFETPPAVLTAQDRCDRCSARACFLYYFLDRGFLAFCGHHNDRHIDALRGRGVLVLTWSPDR